MSHESAVTVAGARQPLPGFAWYDVEAPESSALDGLAHHFQLHELQVEDCRHRPQRAKSEEHPRYIFCVVKALQRADGLAFDDVDIFVGRDYLVTVHSGRSELMEKLRQRAAADRVRRADRLLYMLLDLVVDEYIPLLDNLAEETSEIESEVLQKPDPPMLRRIFALKRDLIEFRRVTSAMREVVNALMRREKGLLGDDLDAYFRDVYDHLVRTVDLIETYRDLLTGALDIYLSAVANRTNQVMKVLTIYGTIALPLLIITGFFGMNLKISWFESPHGLAYAVGLMVLSTLGVLGYFKRKGWF